MKVTVQQTIDTLKAIGEERSKAVDELSYSKQIASLGKNAESLLEHHIEKINLVYTKLLEQVEQFEVCN